MRLKPRSVSKSPQASQRLACSVSARQRVTRPSLRRTFKNGFSIAFMGSAAGGRRAAIIYSLIRTCERHGVNAWEYLRDVLIRISTHPASRIDELLPHLWRPASVPIAPPAQPPCPAVP